MISEKQGGGEWEWKGICRALELYPSIMSHFLYLIKYRRMLRIDRAEWEAQGCFHIFFGMTEIFNFLR